MGSGEEERKEDMVAARAEKTGEISFKEGEILVGSKIMGE